MRFTETDKIAYLLIHTPGIGCTTGKKLMESFDITSVENFVESYRYRCTKSEYDEIKYTLDLIDFSAVEKRLTDRGIEVVSYMSDGYPDSLREYQDMPLFLYTKGDKRLLRASSLAVVGTRFPTRYGLRATEEFVSRLSERFCIVSGMARGIDACAHRTALNSGGKTIAVLGCGIDIVYPPENLGLYKEICERGLVISEYDPGAPANMHNFPARNRIISGLSKGVLVTEAGLKSGTLLTMNFAEKQGKAIFCVPGNIYSKQSGGCNRSIRECQSRAVLDINDIYYELGIKEEEISSPSKLQLDFNEEIIVKLLEEKGETHFEELLEFTDLSVPQLSSLLLKMETMGIVRKTGYNFWSV